MADTIKIEDIEERVVLVGVSERTVMMQMIHFQSLRSW